MMARHPEVPNLIFVVMTELHAGCANGDLDAGA
jgi:hypothetical protein